MKANFFFLLTFLISLFSLSGCTQGISGEGDYIQQSRDLQAFSEIDLSVPAKVTIRQGAAHKIEIRAQANVLEVIETTIGGKELTIGTKKNIRNHKEILITITLPKLEGFEVNGSGDVNSPDVFEGGNVELEINGSGSFAGNFVSEQIKSEISGSGNIRLKGSANEFIHETNGSGDMEAADLRAKSVKVQINGSGNTKVWSDEVLDTEINGSGSVLYKGSPTKESKEVNGSGTVRKI